MKCDHVWKCQAMVIKLQQLYLACSIRFGLIFVEYAKWNCFFFLFFLLFHKN